MRRFVTCLALVSVLAACTSDTPPPGAMTAPAAFPKIGSSWVLRVSYSAPEAPSDRRVGDLRPLGQGAGEVRLAAISTVYHGAPAYGVQNGVEIAVLNPQTFNQMALMRNGRESETFTPDSQSFSWPLWVGKSWRATGSFQGALPATDWGYYREVAAYEDVTVPAGTFKAFRIETSPGANIDRGYHMTQWYAPSVAYVVKWVTSTSGNAMGGSKTTTVEMVQPP